MVCYSAGIYYFDGEFLSNDELQFSDRYSVFPNPVNSENVLTINAKNNEKFSYKIFTSNGVLVMQGASDINNKSIDVSGLDKGIYLLQITDKEGVLSSKIIK